MKLVKHGIRLSWVFEESLTMETDKAHLDEDVISLDIMRRNLTDDLFYPVSLW